MTSTHQHLLRANTDQPLPLPHRQGGGAHGGKGATSPGEMTPHGSEKPGVKEWRKAQSQTENALRKGAYRDEIVKLLLDSDDWKLGKNSCPIGRPNSGLQTTDEWQSTSEVRWERRNKGQRSKVKGNRCIIVFLFSYLCAQIAPNDICDSLVQLATF